MPILVQWFKLLHTIFHDINEIALPSEATIVIWLVPKKMPRYIPFKLKRKYNDMSCATCLIKNLDTLNGKLLIYIFINFMPYFNYHTKLHGNKINS